MKWNCTFTTELNRNTVNINTWANVHQTDWTRHAIIEKDKFTCFFLSCSLEGRVRPAAAFMRRIWMWADVLVSFVEELRGILESASFRIIRSSCADLLPVLQTESGSTEGSKSRVSMWATTSGWSVTAAGQWSSSESPCGSSAEGGLAPNVRLSWPMRWAICEDWWMRPCSAISMPSRSNLWHRQMLLFTSSFFCFLICCS